jgi:SAM-dependent methyltransferase
LHTWKILFIVTKLCNFGAVTYGFPSGDPSHAFDYLQSGLLSLVDKNKNQCIFDLGCGNGHLVNYLLSQGYNAFGTDASIDGITIANKFNPADFSYRIFLPANYLLNCKI